VHPEENKLSSGSAIEIFPVPEKVYISLSQHLGAPAVPIVAKGDKVKTGDLIAKGEAFISANIHSSVSGTVEKIDEWIDTGGYKVPHVIINVEGDEWNDSIDRSTELVKDIKLTSEEIIQKIKEMGVVGLGGAAFPTHVKFMIPEGKKADSLIINAVECEPYLTSDHRLMLERPNELLIGTQILMKALKVEKAYIGIENNKKDAIELLSSLNYSGIEIVPLKVKYPQGAEKQLIKAVLGREVPSGKLPIDIGCVVNNSGSTFATYEAVQKNKPLFERVVTVTGKTVGHPSNFLVRIGTPIGALLKEVEVNMDEIGKIISGGPMMGKAIISSDVPVSKGTSGVLLMHENESHRGEVRNCIRCAKCVEACPMGLEPYLIAAVAKNELWDEAEKAYVMDCMECGCCQFTCPSYRPLVDYLRVGKRNVGQIIRNRAK
ncbi:electron transport complex subunit RsxC, partial [Bacteroidales bacterium OttesenSCG-928-L14]|nr:electron transport complex subunit RsxC [Bacteroidales bacterium OttesenSCG-928-L14]